MDMDEYDCKYRDLEQSLQVKSCGVVYECVSRILVEFSSA